MYNAALRPSAPRYSPRLSSSPYNAIQRFVMYNATNDATWLSAPQRFATRLSVLRRAAMQRYDLFITPRRNVAYSIAALFCSTQRFVCYSAPRLTFTQRSEPQRNATICLLLFASRHGATLRGSVRRSAALRNSTICLSIYPRFEPQRYSTSRSVTLCYSTICLLRRNDDTALRSDTHFIAPLRKTTLLNSTQRFVCQFIIAPRHGSRQRTAAQLGLPRRAATQRNELKLN